MHKFIKQTEQVLNSNTIFFSVELPRGKSNAIYFIEQTIKSGKFWEYADNTSMNSYSKNRTIPNLEWRPVEIDFYKFKEILVDMLVCKRLHFHDLFSDAQFDEKYATVLVDDFWLTILTENSENESEEKWTFYTMPRSCINNSPEEVEFLETPNKSTYRPMSMKNSDNILGKYFSGFGGDCFLIFHTDNRVYCLLTNGC